MATVQDFFLQELLRVFNNTGGRNPDGSTGIQYGGTGQGGAVTGNPTGGSGTGSSYIVGDISDGKQYGPDGNLESEWGYSDWSGDSYIVNYNVSDGADHYDMVVMYRPGTSTPTFLSETIASGWNSFGSAGVAVVDSIFNFERDTWNSFNHWVRDQVFGETVPSQPQEPTTPSEPVAGIQKARFYIATSQSSYAEVELKFGTMNDDRIQGAGLLLGDAGNDILVGNGDAGALRGGTGHDWLDGGVGADLIDGGEGWDVASYQSATSG
ncbi:hypothetical protein KBI52_18905, partial [Microvirga sp. HBU67558]|nr:hypothetical protein [Microvirga sp. HBU67558]